MDEYCNAIFTDAIHALNFILYQNIQYIVKGHEKKGKWLA